MAWPSRGCAASWAGGARARSGGVGLRYRTQNLYVPVAAKPHLFRMCSSDIRVLQSMRSNLCAGTATARRVAARARPSQMRTHRRLVEHLKHLECAPSASWPATGDCEWHCRPMFRAFLRVSPVQLAHCASARPPHTHIRTTAPRPSTPPRVMPVHQSRMPPRHRAQEMAALRWPRAVGRAPFAVLRWPCSVGRAQLAAEMATAWSFSARASWVRVRLAR